ncbi:MAG TPA: hypothetical protein VES60_16260 [Nakamurella sp.]|nr:hypothetical protein [Nakamurella sp.]
MGDLSQARRLPLPGTPPHPALGRCPGLPRQIAAGVPVTVQPETAAMLGAGPSETLAGPALSGTALPGTGPSSDAVASRICEIVGAHLGVVVAPDDDMCREARSAWTAGDADLDLRSRHGIDDPGESVTRLRDDLAVPISFEEAEATRTARLLADVLAPRTRVAAQTPTEQQPEQAPAVPVAGKPADGSAMRHALAPLRIGQGGRSFLVHPVGGTTICYTSMGRRLTTRDSLYGSGFPMELAGRQQSIRDLARL